MIDVVKHFFLIAEPSFHYGVQKPPPAVFEVYKNDVPKLVGNKSKRSINLNNIQKVSNSDIIDVLKEYPELVSSSDQGTSDECNESYFMEKNHKISPIFIDAFFIAEEKESGEESVFEVSENDIDLITVLGFKGLGMRKVSIRYVINLVSQDAKIDNENFINNFFKSPSIDEEMNTESAYSNSLFIEEEDTNDMKIGIQQETTIENMGNIGVNESNQEQSLGKLNEEIEKREELCTKTGPFQE